MTAAARPLVLASTSRYRAALLARLGVPFEVAAPEVDERSFDPLWGELGPRGYALALARAKAAAVARRRPASEPPAWVLGGDQVCVLEDAAGRARRLDKPLDAARNVEQLLALAGRTHTLIGGIVLLDAQTGRAREHVDEQRLSMRAFTRAEAEAYVARAAPYDCAGGYRIEDLGIALFTRIEGADPTGIEGLPLIAVAALLREVGFAVP